MLRVGKKQRLNFLILTHFHCSSFVCLQLLKLARNADFADESGRKQMLSLLNSMLCSVQSPDELGEML